MSQGTITAHGAVLDVLVGVGPRRRAILVRNALPVPGPVAIRAVIDTGASVSGFAPRVFTELELPAVGVTPIITVSTRPDEPHDAELFDVTLSLVGDGRACPVLHARVIASPGWQPDVEGGVEGLIGRDVLDRLHFMYYGTEGTFAIGFADLDPSHH